MPQTNDAVESIDVLRCTESSLDSKRVEIIRETPLTIFINEEEFATLLFAGNHMKELAVGFLKSEGIVDGKEDIDTIEVDEEKGTVRILTSRDVRLREKLFMKRTIASSCGRAATTYNVLDAFQLAKITSSLQVSMEKIIRLMREMNRTAILYKITRGTHNTGLAGSDGLVFLREDIGRHNSADMVIGEAILTGLDLQDKFMLTTGRASSEIVIKAGRAGIPILVSRSAATSLAIRIAAEIGMTLIGAVRAGKMTVYCHPERLSDRQSP